MLLIAASLAAQQLESIVFKQYASKHGEGGMFFNAVICFFALVYTLVTEAFQAEYVFYFPVELWIYGLISGIFYATGFYTMYIALKTGSFGITMLLSSFAVIIPIFYGIIFLREPSNVLTYIAVALIVISLFLMNYQKKNEAETAKKVSPVWVISIALCIAANAGIVIVSKAQQLVLDTKCTNEFLIISYGVATVSLMILSLVYERGKILSAVKGVTVYGFLAGIFNAFKNVLAILTFLYVPVSVVSTVKTALGLVISFVISALLFKEKFTRNQLISAIIGITAVVILNIPA